MTVRMPIGSMYSHDFIRILLALATMNTVAVQIRGLFTGRLFEMLGNLPDCVEARLTEWTTKNSGSYDRFCLLGFDPAWRKCRVRIDCISTFGTGFVHGKTCHGDSRGCDWNVG